MKLNTGKRRYDTKTANLVYKCLKDDTQELLYRKSNGEFFLVTEKLLRYNENHLPVFSATKLTPINYAQAERWGNENMPKELYRNLFVDLSYQDKKEGKKLLINISAKTSEMLLRLQGITGKSKTELINDLIQKCYEDYLIK